MFKKQMLTIIINTFMEQMIYLVWMIMEKKETKQLPLMNCQEQTILNNNQINKTMGLVFWTQMIPHNKTNLNPNQMEAHQFQIQTWVKNQNKVAMSKYLIKQCCKVPNREVNSSKLVCKQKLHFKDITIKSFLI